MTIYTIGFTKKSLREFIETLRKADVRGVIDVWLRNTSQIEATCGCVCVRVGTVGTIGAGRYGGKCQAVGDCGCVVNLGLRLALVIFA